MYFPVTSEQDEDSFVDENTIQKKQVLSKQISQQSRRKMAKSDVVKDRVNIKKVKLEEL